MTTLPRVPKRKMVMRSQYVPEALWNEAKAIADLRDESISDVVRDGLERYVKKHRALLAYVEEES